MNRAAQAIPLDIAAPLHAARSVVDEAVTYRQFLAAQHGLTRLIRATTAAGWTQRQVAAVLGLSQAAIQQRLKKYQPAQGEPMATVQPPTPTARHRPEQPSGGPSVKAPT